ncbi:hypothetical protein BX600DRAFT_438095 [Xylariales sp. PMI_506]|nr:hypothetical protein BX600DRAFT_438095 [Xylariales sp. PMI_506]
MAQASSHPPPPRSSRIGMARHACDACRLRRVKCKFDPAAALSPLSQFPSDSLARDHDRPSQCSRCMRLDLACTFNLPTKPRGPKKRRTATEQGSAQFSQPSQPRVAVTNVARDLSPTTPRYPTDGLCSRDLLKRMMQDYLRHLYPLIPVVHRPSFQRDLLEDRDVENKVFLGLLISISALVTSVMPSRFAEYQMHDPPLRFATRSDMVTYCHNVIMGLRDTTYFDQVNFQKFAIAYMLEISFFQLGEQNRSRMMEVEAMQLGRLLNFHQISQYEGLNCIETQLRKKGFWLLFYAYVHSQLQNLRNEKLTFLDPMLLESINLRDLIPLNVDDELILADQVLPSDPEAPTSLSESFNIHSSVFWAALVPYSTIQRPPVQEPCPCRRATDRAANVAHLEARLQELKYSLDVIPPRLRQWAPLTDDSSSAALDSQAVITSQFASMRANLHVTHLWLQSIIIDQLDAAAQMEFSSTSVLSNANHHSENSNLDSGTKASGGATHGKRRALWAHREEICRQLLHVLNSIPEPEIEPNGMHLTFKVRDMAVGLLACPYGEEDPASKRASAYISELTVILSRLDHSEKAITVSLQSWVDTDRVRGGAAYSMGMDGSGLPQYGEW